MLFGVSTGAALLSRLGPPDLAAHNDGIKVRTEILGEPRGDYRPPPVHPAQPAGHGDSNTQGEEHGVTVRLNQRIIDGSQTTVCTRDADLIVVVRHAAEHYGQAQLTLEPVKNQLVGSGLFTLEDRGIPLLLGGEVAPQARRNFLLPTNYYDRWVTLTELPC